LFFAGKPRRGNGIHVRLRIRDSNIGGKKGTGRQPLAPDELNSGELPDSCCHLVGSRLLRQHDHWYDNLLEDD
jgi:hypothetical protein